MLPNDRSEVSFKCRTYAIAAVNPNEAATVEVDFRMSASLINPVHLEAGRAQRDDGVPKRSAHEFLRLRTAGHRGVVTAFQLGGVLPSRARAAVFGYVFASWRRPIANCSSCSRRSGRSDRQSNREGARPYRQSNSRT